MTSVSLDGRCLAVAVIHSPGLSDLIASTLPAGTWNLKVTYWRGDSYATNSTGNMKGSFHFLAASYRTARKIASAYVSNPDHVRTIRSGGLKCGNSASACSPTTLDLTVMVRAFASNATSSPDHA